MVRYAANLFSVNSSDPNAQSLIKSLGVSTDSFICLQMPGELVHAKYRGYFQEFIGLIIDSSEQDKSVHDLITEEIRSVREKANIPDSTKLTWHVLNYCNINVLLYRRRIFYHVREEWPLVTPNVEAGLVDIEAAQAKVILPRIAPVISPVKPKQPYIEAAWHPFYGDEIAIRGLQHASGPADLSALINGWELLEKSPKSRSGPSANLENLALVDLVDIVAYLWRVHQERNQRAPTAYDVSAYLKVERTTLHRYLKAHRIDFKELKIQAKPRAESLTRQQIKDLESQFSSFDTHKLKLSRDSLTK